jgi:hypothetical protein
MRSEARDDDRLSGRRRFPDKPAICGIRTGFRDDKPRYCHKALRVTPGPGFGYNIDKNGVTWIEAYCDDHGNLHAPKHLIDEANHQGNPYVFKIRGPWDMKRGSHELSLRHLGPWEDGDEPPQHTA